MIEITRTKNKEEAIEKASSRLNQILDAHSHVPTLFLSSGGSSLELLEHIVIFPPNFTVGMTDERFSEDPKVNNFAQLVETSFFQKAQEKGAYFIDTRVQSREDMEALSKRFEDALKEWQKEHPGGRIVITQGMGLNGHTAGMMPYPKEKDMFQELFEGDALVRGYDAGGVPPVLVFDSESLRLERENIKNRGLLNVGGRGERENAYPLRVTITMTFLRIVDHSVLYTVGKEKEDALSRTLKTEGTLREMPARIIHEMKDVHLFTDIQ